MLKQKNTTEIQEKYNINTRIPEFFVLTHYSQGLTINFYKKNFFSTSDPILPLWLHPSLPPKNVVTFPIYAPF